MSRESQWSSDSAVTNTVCKLHGTIAYSLNSVSGFVNCNVLNVMIDGDVSKPSALCYWASWIVSTMTYHTTWHFLKIHPAWTVAYQVLLKMKVTLSYRLVWVNCYTVEFVIKMISLLLKLLFSESNGNVFSYLTKPGFLKCSLE